MNKVLFVIFACGLAGSVVQEAFAQPCAGCDTQANPTNRNAERREGRPDLPPETDSRDSTVRPPDIPVASEPPLRAASAVRGTSVPTEIPRNSRNSQR